MGEQMAKGGVNRWLPVLAIAFVVALVTLWLGVPTFKKWRADRLVDELCAKDGGIKVYERIVLGLEMFDKFGEIQIPLQKEAKPSDRYYYTTGTNWILRKGMGLFDLDLRRHHDKLFRVSDGKLLAEGIGYARRGGDPIGPWHPSHYACPLQSDIKYVNQKSGNDLVLNVSSADKLTFKDWYASSANHSVVTLQIVAEAMAAFDAASDDPLRGKKVQRFDFQGLVDSFDAARANNPGLSSWALCDALLNAHLGASDSEALGGDLAYQYGRNGTLAGLGVEPLTAVLVDPQFGSQPQTLRPSAELQQGVVRLG